jgi:hypothetical protein
MADALERLDKLELAIRKLDWRDDVPDDLQSEIRLWFNEALAGGPNMNGDAGPTLKRNHALDCIWATRKIAELTHQLPEPPEDNSNHDQQ